MDDTPIRPSQRRVILSDPPRGHLPLGHEERQPLPSEHRAAAYWRQRRDRGRFEREKEALGWRAVRLAREAWALLRGKERQRVVDLDTQRAWADVKAARRELDGVMEGERRAKEVLEGVKKKAIEARRRKRKWRAKPMGEWRD